MYISKEETGQMLETVGTLVYRMRQGFVQATAEDIADSADMFSVSDAFLIHAVSQQCPGQVLTAVDLDPPAPDGHDLALIPGFHYANRWGFIVLANPLPEKYTQDDIFLYGA